MKKLRTRIPGFPCSDAEISWSPGTSGRVWGAWPIHCHFSRFQSQVSPRGAARKREGPAECHFSGFRHRKKSLWHIRKFHMHFEKVADPNPRFGFVWTPGMQCPWNIQVGLGAPGKCQDLGGTWYTRVCSKDPSSIPFRVRRLTVCCEPLLLPAAASCCSHVPPRCWHLAKQVLPHFGGCIPGRLRRAPRAADAFTRSACAAERGKIAGFANGGAASAEQ